MTRTVHELMDLSGRTVAITGGAGHIGRAAASAYAQLGARVVLVDRDEQALAAARNDIGADSCDTVVADLEHDADRERAIDEIEDATGRLDVLVNCAAFVGSQDLKGWTVPFEQQSIDTWRRTHEVNVTAAFHLTQLAAPHLREAPSGGTVVNVSSIHGLVGPDMRLYENTSMGNPAAYAASKGGLIQLTRWLATVLAPDIRVNAMAPGGIARGQHAEFVDRYENRTPLQRLGAEEDLIGAFVYLGSDLSAYVTGQVLGVDGGWTAW